LNAQLRRTFYLFVVGFVALVGVLAYWQVYARESLATDPANRLQSQRVQEVARGLILAGDGETELARSEQDDNGTYERVYPEGPLYAGRNRLLEHQVRGERARDQPEQQPLRRRRARDARRADEPVFGRR
jgi:cell division protein FtsI/penicillin-binding protein 2